MKRRPLKSVDRDGYKTLKEIIRCHRGTLNNDLIQTFFKNL